MSDGKYGHPDGVLIMKWVLVTDSLNLDNMTGQGGT